MKCTIPEVSLHNREPVLSVDFQYVEGEIRRLATGGTDAHVLIWYVAIGENGTVNLEIACDIRRHVKAVNIVRFSPNGSLLASGDDEAAIWLWNKVDNNPADIFNESEEQDNKEQWSGVRMLRGHIEDVYDLCWSPNGNFLISGSVDNTAIVWDIQKGRSTNILSDHKGFVQGVAWDPEDKFLATLSSDRACRIYKINNLNRVHLKVDKAIVPMAGDKIVSNMEAPPRPTRLFHDDTFKSFCRRLAFTPDGELLIAPSGFLQSENGKSINATYIFHRDSLNKPVIYLPSKDKYTLAVRCCPVLFTLRGKENTQSMFSLPYRMVFAVATQDSVLFYDTQQTNPFAMVSKIHYTGLSDLTWSKDGRILAVSSTDGYCSFISFGENELGIPFTEKLPNFKEKPEPKKKKKTKKDTSATHVVPKEDDVKMAIPVGDSDIKTTKSQPAKSQPAKAQPAISVSSACSTQSNQPERKRVQLVTLFSPKLRSTIQVFKKNASGETQPSMQTTILEDSPAKKKSLDMPEDTIMEVDKSPNTKSTSPSVVANEETINLKLDLSDSEDDVIGISPQKERIGDGPCNSKQPNMNESDKSTFDGGVSAKLTDDMKKEKTEVKHSEETVNAATSTAQDIAVESDKRVDSVSNELPTLQISSRNAVTPPRPSSSSHQCNEATPPGSGVRQPRRVQLITLSASKKSKSTSENKRNETP